MDADKIFNTSRYQGILLQTSNEEIPRTDRRTKFQPRWTEFFELVGAADIVPYLLTRLAAKFKRSPAHTASHNVGKGIVP